MSRCMKPAEQLDDIKRAHIVRNFRLGGAGPQILIADNYCVKTQNEVENVLNRCARIALEAYRRNKTAAEAALCRAKAAPL